jgi:polysaccharide export outer membrane protein
MAPSRTALLPLLVLSMLALGCQNVMKPERPLDPHMVPTNGVPTELNRVALPTYTIGPPDILLIDAARVVPKPPYTIQPLDVLQILVDGTLRTEPIAGNFPVEPGGTVNLGPSYGRVKVSGMSIDEATRTIDKHLRGILRDPTVSVSLVQAAAVQQVFGEHLVGPDGTVNLGTYGSVFVAGMTLAQARAAVEQKLDVYLEDPEVSIDVFSYNSKVYYIIVEGPANGDQVFRQPVTGNETVLDALASVQGLPSISSDTIWISRPTPGQFGCDQVLPVNWKDITRGGSTATNYQVLPGDRIFIKVDPMFFFNGWVQKMLTPFERAFGFTLLGTQTIQAINRSPKGFQF